MRQNRLYLKKKRKSAEFQCPRFPSDGNRRLNSFECSWMHQNVMLLCHRVFVVVLVVLSIMWIPVVETAQGSQLFHYIQSIQSFLSPPICAVYVLAVTWKRVNEKVIILMFFFDLCAHIWSTDQIVNSVVLAVRKTIILMFTVFQVAFRGGRGIAHSPTSTDVIKLKHPFMASLSQHLLLSSRGMIIALHLFLETIMFKLFGTNYEVVNLIMY